MYICKKVEYLLGKLNSENIYNMEKNKKNILDETVIAGNRIFVENDEVKMVLSEELQNGGDIDLEDFRAILHNLVDKTYALK